VPPERSRIGARVVEGIHRVARFDLQVEAETGCDIANRDLHTPALAVPEELDLFAPTQPQGQFSRGWTHALKDTAGRHLFQVHAETETSVSSASASRFASRAGASGRRS
jgi:hypothetical protein